MHIADRDGRSIVGIEDMAAVPGRDMLVLSAYDRRAAARALRDGLPPPRNGGLYLLDLRRTVAGGGHRTARRLDGATVRRPHGIVLSGRAGAFRLFVIERRRDAGRRAVAILQMRLDVARARLTDVRLVAEGPAWCAANDLAFDETANALFVTLDHAACHGPRRWWEDLVAAASGRLIRIDTAAKTSFPLQTPDEARTVLDSLVWPNGVAIAGDAIWVAETRARRLRVLDRWNLAPRALVPLAGAPDNLSVLATDRIADEAARRAPALLVAVHDSLWRLALFRAHLFGTRRVTSRILQVQADGSARTLVTDDGHRLSAATSALVLGDRLIAASGWDDRLLICRLSAGEGSVRT